LEFYFTRHSSLTDPSTTGLFTIRRPGKKGFIVPEKTPEDMVRFLRRYPELLKYELVWIDSHTGKEILLPKEIQTPGDLLKYY
jgi:hypothetical protein